MARATLVATLTTPDLAAELAALPASARALFTSGDVVLELRADLAGEPSASALRATLAAALGDGAAATRLLYTLRSKGEGGLFVGTAEERVSRLVAAGTGFDLVDLEGMRDLVPAVLAAVAPARRIVSWHGPASSLDALRAAFGRLSGEPAGLYKLVATARAPGEDLSPLALLKTLRRGDVVAFAAGDVGTWTRLLAPRLGAPWVYVALGSRPGAPGQPTLARFVTDFGLPELPPVRFLCGVAGNPVAHSLSPRLHNAGYRALGIPALYLPFHVEAFGDFWLEVVESGSLDVLGFPLTGLSVTAPHKAVALAIAGAASPLAQSVGAANTMVLHEGVWEAENTDPEGVLQALAERGVDVAGRQAVVVGAGGAGRAAAIGLLHAGAAVRVANRGSERGEQVAADLGIAFVPLAELDLAGCDLAVNATVLGRGEGEPLPFAVASLPAGAAVVDLVYGRAPTPLVRAARERGLVAVDGREVLLGQARRQFQMMTGHELPMAVGRQALGLADRGAEGTA